MKPDVKTLAMIAAFAAANVAGAGCLDEAPKPSSDIYQKCLQLGTFGMNRGAAPYIPYEKAEDGLEKEHMPPRGPRTSLLDFTKKNTGRLLGLMESDLPVACAYFYEGERYDLKDSRQRMAFHLRKSKAKPIEKRILIQVFESGNSLNVRDLARLSREYADLAAKLGNEIFEDQLIPHAGSLEPSYREEYLRKMKATLASLKGSAMEYHPSDCDYLNAPINHLYGLMQMSRITAEMVTQSCPGEQKGLGLQAKQAQLTGLVDKEWKASVQKAVMGRDGVE